VLAEGKDARAVHAGELAEGIPATVAADADVSQVLATMSERQVRRLPVLDGDRLVGIVAQADVARALPDPKVGDLVQALSVD
jgi:CBS domain-containing protein